MNIIFDVKDELKTPNKFDFSIKNGRIIRNLYELVQYKKINNLFVFDNFLIVENEKFLEFINKTKIGNVVIIERKNNIITRDRIIKLPNDGNNSSMLKVGYENDVVDGYVRGRFG